MKSNDKVSFLYLFLGCYQTKETPFSVGLALLVHKKTRSKAIVNILAELNLSINYEKTMRIETDIANAVTAKMSENDGKYIPPPIHPGSPVYFAVDNCDFKNDTPDGKHEFHGTAQIVYQASIENTVPSKLQIERKYNRSLNYDPFPIAKACPKPIPPNEIHTAFVSDMKDVNLYSNWDTTWFFTKTLNNREEETSTPTWAAYNSLITAILPTTTYCGLPLYPGSPTDWSNLYENLKICQDISAVISPSSKTIITLDLQLYSKALQLQARNEVKSNFIFRLGELHIVFAFLHAMGKYIECSGLDQILVEAGIYGPATLDQILRGKHMKRGMEAHMILYLTLHNRYVSEYFIKQPHNEEKLSSLISKYLLNFDPDITDNSFLREKHMDIVQDISNEEIFKSLNDFDKQLKHQPKFLRNYMQMFEILLLFTRATMQGLWNLHLTALQLMVPYFFVNDLQNYARLMPEYLAQMYSLKQNDPEYFEQGNFIVNKSTSSFCGIGPDHGIGQENRSMKVLGGLIGLLQNKPALQRFGLAAPELNRLCDDFLMSNNITRHGRSQHYQLTGSTNVRIKNSVQTLSSTMDTFRSVIQSLRFRI